MSNGFMSGGRLRVLGGVIALGIGLAACGGGDDTGDAAGSPASGARAEAIVTCLQEAGYPDAEPVGSHIENATAVHVTSGLGGPTLQVFDTKQAAAQSADPSLDQDQVGDVVIYDLGHNTEPKVLADIKACL